MNTAIAIPPKYPVASVIGISEREERHRYGRLSGKERNFTVPAVTRYQPSGSNWSRCALTSASRTLRMNPRRTVLNQPIKARIARRLDLRTNRL